MAALSSMIRGGVRLSSKRVAQAALEPDGRVGITRGRVVEHLENTEAGVEQSFSFADRPEGHGDLVIRIAVSGEAYAGQTAQGLHFVDPTTGLGVRYGVATWVDGRGQRSAVPANFEVGHIVLRIPERVLDESAYPAVLDPVIGPELGIDAPAVAVAAGSQTQQAVAFGGGAYLVVWRDQRSTGTSDIYGVRVSSAGTILDSSGIAISTAKGDQTVPKVVWGGSGWMVAWLDTRQNPSKDIFAARVTPSGTVLDPDGIAVSTTLSNDLQAMASDGQNYLIAYKNQGVKAKLVSSSGTVGATLDVSGDQYALSISAAYNGANYLVSFSDNISSISVARVAGHRVSPAGVVDTTELSLCSSPKFSACDSGSPVATSDGTNWFVVWRGGSFGLYAQRVTNAGAVLDGPTGKFLVSGATSYSVAFGGNNYGVFWDSGGEIYGMALDTLGAVTTPATALIGEPGLSSAPSASHDGTSFFITFQDSRFYNAKNQGDVFGLRIANTLTKLDVASQLLSRAANPETRPAVAYNGTNYLAVWEDRRQGQDSEIYGARLGTDGTALDPNGIAICQAAGDQLSPAVAATGADWLVAWQDARSSNDDIYAARVSGGGAVLDPTGIAVKTGTGAQDTPAVSSDGTNWLVAWHDAANSEIWARRISQTGSTLDGGGLQISAGGGTKPAVAFNGTNHLVAWTRPGATLTDIAAARVTPAGVVLDTGNFAINVAATPLVEQSAAIASNGVDWLVTWNAAGDILGARVAAGGALLDPTGISISTAANTQSAPSAAWDGTQYWVVWQDERVVAGSTDVYGARLNAGGAVTDPAGLVIASDPTQDELGPVIAAGPQKETLLV